MKHLEWGVTNETVCAIVAGLNPQPSDSILAILGGGDQALALLEHAPVTAVDIDKRYIRFARNRVKFLKNGNYQKFLNAGACPTPLAESFMKNRLSYFTQERLEKILKRLSELKIVEEDIFNVVKKIQPTKVYLSNALDYVEYGQTAKSVRIISKALPSDGLVYITSSIFGSKIPRPKDLKLDSELTAKARSLESGTGFKIWTPEVYRKM